jgi:hypothetical protein
MHGATIKKILISLTGFMDVKKDYNIARKLPPK